MIGRSFENEIEIRADIKTRAKIVIKSYIVNQTQRYTSQQIVDIVGTALLAKYFENEEGKHLVGFTIAQ